MSLLDHDARVEQARVAGTCFSDGLMLPEMVVIPPGSFLMGADTGTAHEKPRHRVEIKHWLAISRYPITFEQWDAYAEGDSSVYKPDDQGWGRGRLPVCDVSWEDAISYMRWLSIAAGRGYRLPSESEWEYCCRAGSEGEYSTGNQISVKEANFLYTESGDDRWRGSTGHGRVISKEFIGPLRHAWQRARSRGRCVARNLRRRSLRWVSLGAI